MFNNKNIKRIAAILVWILVIAMVLSTFSYLVFAEEEEGNPSSLKSEAVSDEDAYLEDELAFMSNLVKFIEAQYAGKVTAEELVNNAYQGMLEGLDPYSVYYVEKEGGEAFTQYAAGTFYGIGASLLKDNKGVKIEEFQPDSSGEQAGLEIGDYFVEIDGEDVREASAAAVVLLLKGDAGTTVSVTVDRDGEQHQFQVIRSKVVKSSAVSGVIEEDIGYMAITNFYEATDQDVQKQWKALKEKNPEMKGLIVDLRDNLGGVMEAAIRAAELFLEPGDTIMHYIKKGEVIATYTADKEKLIDVPVVLLVNEHSASASEVFAGALQDNDAATLVGTTTYGKGAAQVVHELKNGASMKLTTMYFVTPDKHEINGVGVAPDYTVYNKNNEEKQERVKAVGSLAPMSEEKKYVKGETGLNVFGAQQRLTILGEEGLSPNATIDEKTFEAIKKFQKKEGLYAYGGLDFATMKALDSAIAKEINSADEDNQLDKAISLLK